MMATAGYFGDDRSIAQTDLLVTFVMAGHSRPKDGIASARLCPAIHVFKQHKKDVEARDI